LLEAFAYRLDARDVLKAHDVGSQAGDVGGGHAGAAQGVGGPVAPDTDALHVDAGGEDVDELSKVGEAGDPVVGLVDGADSDGGVGRSGRRVGRVLRLAAGRHDGDDAGSFDLVDGRVDSPAGRTAERHVHDGPTPQSHGSGVVRDLRRKLLATRCSSTFTLQ